MRLNQAEIIQILRKRTGMNQGDFGAKAFHASVQTGRTKIKNIELGKQKPTTEDLDKIANLLNIPVSQLTTGTLNNPLDTRIDTTLDVSPSTLTHFPGLDVYLDLLNKAATLDDVELINHIAAKICDLLDHGRSITHATP